MKKYILAFLVFGTWAVGAGAQSQYDPKALTVLDAMSAKYKKMGAYSAKITESLVNEVDGINESRKIEVSVKNNMFRLKTEGNEIYNDGTTVWTYLSEVNEVNIDNYDPTEEEISPSQIYTAYKKGYKYLWMEETTINGVRCDVIDLVKEDTKNSQIFKIRMNISQKDRTLVSWTVFERSGNRYKYTVENFQENIKVEDSHFKFNASKFPGVEIVDLR